MDGYFNYIIGNVHDVPFYILLAVCVIDVITGVVMACARKSDHTIHGQLESRQLLKGIYRKMGMLCVYFLTLNLSYYAKIDVIVELVLIAFIAHEGISIVENLALLGVPIPKKLKDMLEVLSKKGGE